MAGYFLTVVITLVLLLMAFAVLVLVRTPRYRLEAEDLIELLRATLAGTADVNEWNVFTSVPFRHEANLEAARQQCLKIESQYWLGGERLFSQAGMAELQAVLGRLELQYPQAAKSTNERF